MKLLFLAPGTANYFCGTCMRDHTLAARLRDRGHDVVVASMYLPLLLDRPDPSLSGPLFFGGLNCYLQQVSPFFRKTPRWLDALFDRPGLLHRIGKKSATTQARDLGEMTLSMLRGLRGNQVKEVRRLARWIATTSKPDVVVLSNALLTGVAEAVKAESGATVVCTLQGERSFIDDYPPEWHERIIDQLKRNREAVDLFVAVSENYRRSMSDLLDLSDTECVAVLNGIETEDFPPADAPPPVPILGFLSRMCHAKGVDRFVDAFIHLKTHPGTESVRALIAGSKTAADDRLVDELKTRLAAAGLTDSVDWRPDLSLEEKAAFLRECSFLTVPLRYDEAFGLYTAEAMSVGVPLVLPAKGSFPEIVGAHQTGYLYDEETPEGLAAAWLQALNDPDAPAVRERARATARAHFTAERMAVRFEAALAPLRQHGHADA